MFASSSSPCGRPLASGRATDPTRRAIAGAACWLAIAGASAGDAIPNADTPVTALWTAVPLREWAGRMTTLAGRPVVVDRRLDPDAPVTRDCRDEPLDQVLAGVAGDVGAAVEPMRSWIRIAAPESSGRAAAGERARAAELATLSPDARRILAVRRGWTWADGARPRDLVSAAAAEGGVVLAGVDAVPHDHLPAATLSALPLAERLDLLLAHYDQRVSWIAADEGRVAGTIVALPAAPPRTSAAAPRPARRGPAPPARDGTRFTLTLEAPLDEAVRAIGSQLGLEPSVDRESLAARGILPGEIVRANVADATRDQLLDAVVAPLGLRWRVDGSRLIVDAPP